MQGTIASQAFQKNHRDKTVPKLVRRRIWLTEDKILWQSLF
jgi:hypothetical protein